MTDLTSTRKSFHPAMGGKVVVLKSGLTLTGATDTLTMTLATYGITNVLAVEAFVQTTDYDIMVPETTGSTSVAGGVLTYLTQTGNNSKRRVVIVYGE